MSLSRQISVAGCRSTTSPLQKLFEPSRHWLVTVKFYSPANFTNSSSHSQKKKKKKVSCFGLSVMTSTAFHPLAKGFRLPDFSHLVEAVEGSNSSSSGPSVDMRMRSGSLEVLRLLLTSDFILFWALKALSQFADEMGKTRRICTRRRMFFRSIL